MRAAVAVAVVVFASSTALAEQQQPCALQQRVSLAMTTEADGLATVPATVNGLQGQMILDTGSLYSATTQGIAAKLGLPLFMNPYASLANSVTPNGMVLVKLRLGDIASNWGMLVIPDSAMPSTLSGLLGQDALSSFDVEFDSHDGKLNLFLPNTCTTNAAYWTHGPVAVVPFDMNKSAHMVIKAFLDGKQVNALLDTGSSSSYMSIEKAKDVFGLSDDDPRLKPVREARINGGALTPISAFPFSSLQFEGVAIANPQIALVPNDIFKLEYGADMILGENVLKELRFYIAYKERKIYLTGAEAK